MIDYIYMTNLSIYINISYFIFGFGLNIISYNIAIKNFEVKKTPLLVMILTFFLGNIAMIAFFSLINIHVGLYFLVSIIMPYAIVWRIDF